MIRWRVLSRAAVLSHCYISCVHTYAETEGKCMCVYVRPGLSYHRQSSMGHIYRPYKDNRVGAQTHLQQYPPCNRSACACWLQSQQPILRHKILWERHANYHCMCARAVEPQKHSRAGPRQSAVRPRPPSHSTQCAKASTPWRGPRQICSKSSESRERSEPEGIPASAVGRVAGGVCRRKRGCGGVPRHTSWLRGGGFGGYGH